MAKRRKLQYGDPHTITIGSGDVPNPTVDTVNAGDSIVFMNVDRFSTKRVRYASDKMASKVHPFALIIPPSGQVEILAVASGDKSNRDIVYYTVDTILSSGRIKKKRKKKRKHPVFLDDTYQVIVNS